MAAAYAFADNSGPKPRELVLLSYIDYFGVEAVMKRSYLGAGEMRRMMRARRIVEAYQARAKAANWWEWATANPDMNALLEQAMLAGEDG